MLNKFAIGTMISKEKKSKTFNIGLFLCRKKHSIVKIIWKKKVFIVVSIFGNIHSDSYHSTMFIRWNRNIFIMIIFWYGEFSFINSYLTKFLSLFFQLGDYQFLNNIVHAMHQFQRLSGPMNLVISKGRASEFICNNLQKLNAFSRVIDDSPRDCLIDLFVFDREEDYATLMLSQLNYSGIIDETFGINCGKIQFNPDGHCNQKQDNLIKHNLLKDDQIFADVRDKFFSSVCSTLKEKGQKLRQKSYERQTMNLSEMKNFLTKEICNLQSEHKLLFTRKYFFRFFWFQFSFFHCPNRFNNL